MSNFLANENVPAEAIELARKQGLNVAWMHDVDPGADDDAVLELSLAHDQVLVTFDKDFGEMAFRSGTKATCGVVLLRPRLRDPAYVARFMVAVLSQAVTWEGHFSVAREGKLRVVPLPTD